MRVTMAMAVGIGMMLASGNARCETPALHSESPSAENALGENALVVSGPERVQDTTLRTGKFWGKWNFGKSQFLQVGAQPSTVYDTYRSVSLIRFDFSALSYMKVDSAKLRLYFPRDLIQQLPVPIRVYRVNVANADWREGGSEAREEPGAACWDALDSGRRWAGGAGLASAGVDYSKEPLDTKTVNGLDGEWVEFSVPKELVQSWMDNPNLNAGLLIKTDDDAQPGQSTYICSSQHWSGKGPQLVITGKISDHLEPRSIYAETNYNPRFQLAPAGPVYYRWLKESPSRYAVWAQDKAINLNGAQAVFPYMWDIVFRGDFILPNAMLPLSTVTEEIPDVVSQGDRARARKIMEDFMKYMMVFDYERDQNWYDSGPTVDVLSPLQVAQFFVKSEENGGENGVHGIYSQYDDGRWNKDSPSTESLEADIKEQLATIRERLNPTADQYAKIEAAIRQNMPLEKLHARELKSSLDTVRQLVEKRVDGVEMLQALRKMFFHHRMFLIHQSLFSMPKYSVLMDNCDILAYAQWFYSVRHGQYSHERIGRQLAAATRFMWKPSEHQEAEYADFQNCDWANTLTNYSGTGYVVFDKRSDGRLDWQIDVPREGTYRLLFRYSLSDEPAASLKVAVGGVELNSPLRFSRTESNVWATNTLTVTLHAGQNDIGLTAFENGSLALDYLDLELMEQGRIKQISANVEN